MKENYFLTFLKGLLMGVADVIPGVSGGTIALITGIYERFVNGLNNITLYLQEKYQNIRGKTRSQNRHIFNRIDFAFFIPLMMGTGLAFVIGSHYIPGMIEKYPAQVYGFFIGLIIASAYILYKGIKKKNLSGYLLGFAAVLVGFLLALIPANPGGGTPNIFWIFVVGAIAVCAMLLPGISGSYIVLVLGQYSFLLSMIPNILTLWPYFIAFSLGGVVGILAFSKLLSFFLNNHHDLTMFALTGVMVGSVYRPINDTLSHSGDFISGASAVLLLFVGIIVVYLLDRFANNRKRRFEN